MAKLDAASKSSLLARDQETPRKATLSVKSAVRAGVVGNGGHAWGKA